MNDAEHDHELRQRFHDLRRHEARAAPAFARVYARAAAPRHHAWPGFSWKRATRTTLAVAAMAVVAVGVVRRRTPAPDAATLAASALRTVADLSPRTPALPRWHSPTAFLLSPLNADSSHTVRP